MFDTGLLKHMAGVDNSAILLKSDYQFKGPLTENYVLQQLRGQFEVEPRYFSDKNSEINFVLQYGTEIIPVEAKGSEDKSAPSFKRYVAQRRPEYALRFSKRGYRRDGGITKLPLYLARKTRDLLRQEPPSQPIDLPLQPLHTLQDLLKLRRLSENHILHMLVILLQKGQAVRWRDQPHRARSRQLIVG